MGHQGVLSGVRASALSSNRYTPLLCKPLTALPTLSEQDVARPCRKSNEAKETGSRAGDQAKSAVIIRYYTNKMMISDKCGDLMYLHRSLRKSGDMESVLACKYRVSFFSGWFDGVEKSLFSALQRTKDALPSARIHRYKKKIRAYRRWEVIYAEELDYLRDYCSRLERVAEQSGHEFVDPIRRFGVVPEVLNEEVCERAAFYRKASRTRNKWSGLSAEQAFSLEVSCLERLRAVKDDAEFHPFPEVRYSSRETLEIEMSYCGQTLTSLAEKGVKLRVPEWEAQVANIVRLLEKAGVMHFDIHPNGQNLCVNEFGQLALIDFDIAVLQGVEPFSFQIYQRKIKALEAAESYSSFATQSLHAAIERNRKVLDLS